jgi:hypothetical protein
MRGLYRGLHMITYCHSWWIVGGQSTEAAVCQGTIHGLVAGDKPWISSCIGSTERFRINFVQKKIGQNFPEWR